MNSRQRVEAAFRHEQPDRTPIFEYVLLSPVADRVLGRPYEDFGGDAYAWARRAKEMGFDAALSAYARDRVDMAERLGHDMIYCVGNPPPSFVEGDLREPAYEPMDITADPVDIIRRRNERDEEALARPRSQDTLMIYPLLRREMERRELDLPLYAPAFRHGVWTDAALMQTMVLDPEVAHHHFRLMTQYSLRDIDCLAALGIDIIGIGGDFSGTRPLISPASYRKYIVPELKILSDRIHALGRWACNASDGDLWSVVDDFLISTGTDAYGEIDQGAGMDLGRLKARFGDRITFLGNMDCGVVLSFGTPEEIAARTVQCIREGWGGGGHIFTASNAIASSVPFENYMAMVNAYRAYFDMAPVIIP